MPEPLTEEERTQVERLLGSPLFFPDDFKTWVQEQLQIQQVKNTGSGLLSTLPAGLIFAFAGSVAPPGSLLCDGASVLRAGTYSRLFSAIGSTYGSVDADHFNVPDLQSRVLVGAGVLALGANDGLGVGSRGIAHHHRVVETASVEVWGDTDDSGDHAHVVGGYLDNVYSGGDAQRIMPSNENTPFLTGYAGNHGHGVYASGSAYVDTDTSGGGTQDSPSFMVVNYVINF